MPRMLPLSWRWNRASRSALPISARAPARSAASDDGGVTPVANGVSSTTWPAPPFVAPAAPWWRCRGRWGGDSMVRCGDSAGSASSELSVSPRVSRSRCESPSTMRLWRLRWARPRCRLCRRALVPSRCGATGVCVGEAPDTPSCSCAAAPAGVAGCAPPCRRDGVLDAWAAWGRWLPLGEAGLDAVGVLVGAAVGLGGVASAPAPPAANTPGSAPHS